MSYPPVGYYPPPGQPMVPQGLPGGAKAVAIVAIVLGSLWALGGMCSVPMLLSSTPSAGQTGNPMMYDQTNRTYFLCMEVLHLVLGSFLLASGILCLRLSPPWRRFLILAAGMLALVTLADQIFRIGAVNPHIAEQFERRMQENAAANHQPPPPAGMGRIMSALMASCGLGCGFLALGYFIWAAIALTRPHVIAAFDNPGGNRGGPIGGYAPPMNQYGPPPGQYAPPPDQYSPPADQNIPPANQNEPPANQNDPPPPLL